MAGGPSYGPLLEMDSDQVREAISDHVVLGLEVARNAAGKTRAGGTLLLMGGTGGRWISRDLGIAGGGAKAGRGQARAGARAVAPEGRGDDGDGSPRADRDGHTAGRDRLAAARQHRPLRPRPPLPGGLGGDEPLHRQTPIPAIAGPSDLAARSLRGRPGRPGQGHPRAGAGAARTARRARGGARASFEAREDRRHPHRRGLRVPRSAGHPQAEGGEALRLHLRLRRRWPRSNGGSRPSPGAPRPTWSSPTCCGR
jgi:hypothetical protein